MADALSTFAFRLKSLSILCLPRRIPERGRVSFFCCGSGDPLFWPLLITRGEFVTPFGPSALQNIIAAFAAGPFSKTVLVGALAPAGLICAFHSLVVLGPDFR